MPLDDLFDARALLRIVRDALERADSSPQGMESEEASDMFLLIAINKLNTLQRLLNDDEVPGMWEQYRRVRREEILEQWERAE